MSPFPLTHIVHQAQHLLGEVLTGGELAVDLTAGSGRDTLFLARCVGGQGRVLAFDVQREALTRSADLLAAEGIASRLHEAPSDNLLSPGVHLIHDCHGRLADYLDGPPAAVMANLGYLPGGGKGVTTRLETTLPALECALRRLAPGGRLAVAVYVGHPGGDEEGRGVEELLCALPPRSWQVLRLHPCNCTSPPFLLVAEKRP